MTQHIGGALAALSLVLAPGIGAGATAQVRRQPGTGSAPAVPMEISLKIGSATYAAQSPGSCTHAPKASIYNVVSEMWTARHQAEGRSLQLTLWRPADGSSAMFTLSVNDRKSVLISTVRGGEMSGTGTVKMDPSGKGGTFQVEAKAAGGEAITGTIRCEAFTPHIAAGG